jgi:hypothetical protein
MSALLAKAKAAIAGSAKTATDTATTVALSKALGTSTTAELTPIIGAAGGTTSFLSTISTTASQIGLFFTTYKMQLLYGLGIALAIGLAIWGILIWFKVVKSPFPATVTPQEQKAKAADIGSVLNASSSAAKTVVKEGFDSGTPVAPVARQEYNMVNIQPMAIKQIAYIGPTSDGVFDVETGTGQALRGGFRTFVFQIDYLKKESEIPVLVYRSDNGALLSKNTGDIGKVAETITNLAFRPEVPKYTEPVIIYLHFLRAPKDDPSADTSEYLLFLSKVAKALSPLAPQHLNMTPLGAFRRQMQESTLLTAPFNSFNNGQVIILCNADTSSFRNHKPQINPAEDLDYWVNMRVYMNTDIDAKGSLGVTLAPPKGTVPSAIVVSLPNLLKLSSKEMDAFVAESKQQFVIALPSQEANPSTEEMSSSLNRLGLNMIPLDIFSDDIDKVKALVGQYNNLTYRPKPLGLRNASA